MTCDDLASLTSITFQNFRILPAVTNNALVTVRCRLFPDNIHWFGVLHPGAFEMESPMRSLTVTVVLLLPVLALAQTADQPLAPWGSNHHPTDVAKRHVEQISVSRHVYTV